MFKVPCVFLLFIAKMIDLPRIFWHEQGIGGGVIQVFNNFRAKLLNSKSTCNDTTFLIADVQL